MRRLLCRVVLAAGALPFAFIGSSSAAVGSAPLIPTHPGQRLPAASTSVQSSNWSGYADTSSKHNITAVLNTFTVPGVSSPPSGFAATWGGIGGYRTHDLIQAGVAESAEPLGHYYAWYEMLPAASKPIHNCSGESSCPVAPGDRITVKINQVGTNRWKFALSDAGHWSWTKTVTYKSSRSSAEWILEAPMVGGGQTKLPHVNTAFFGPHSTFVKAGKTDTISQGNPVKIVMVTGSGKREATPSALIKGQEFNDCAHASSCPAP